MRKIIKMVLVASLAVLVASGGWENARAFPSKPITIVVPWKAGGAAGLQAQELGHVLGPMLGQRVLVTFKPGGASETGALFAKNATPDGHTLLQAWIATLVQLPLTKQQLGYDPFRDFEYLAYAGGNPVVLLARSDRPWNNVADYVEHVRSTPGETHTFSGGPAISLHSLFCDALFRNAGIGVKGVFYRGSGAALPDLLGGNIEVSCHFFEAVKRFSGQIKPLAVFSKARVPGFEQVATVREQGFKAPTVPSWSGYVAPAGLSAAARQKLVESLRSVLTDAAFATRMQERHNTFVEYKAPDQFQQFVRESIAELKPILERARRSQ